MKCPECGNELDEDNYCSECMEFIDNPIGGRLCPYCGEELDEDNYCNSCMQYYYEEENTQELEEIDYDSMVNNGDSICLNCTFWSVSPYGSAHGMIYRKGQISDGPGDSCGLFVQEYNFANYGDAGQYQFNETNRAISNKLYHWKNSG